MCLRFVHLSPDLLSVANLPCKTKRSIRCHIKTQENKQCGVACIQIRRI